MYFMNNGGGSEEGEEAATRMVEEEGKGIFCIFEKVWGAERKH